MKRLHYPIKNPNKTISTTTLNLNDNLKLILHTTQFKNRPQKDVKYKILRLNKTCDPDLDETEEVLSGNFEPTKKLLNATINYSVFEKEQEETSRNCHSVLETELESRNYKQRAKSTLSRTHVIRSKDLVKPQEVTELQSYTSTALALPSIKATPTRFKLMFKQEQNPSRTKRAKSLSRTCKVQLNKTISVASRKHLKKTMMTIFERYNLMPKEENPDPDLLTTDVMFKKMHAMLAPNKASWLKYLKHGLNVQDADFLEKIKKIEQEAEEEIKQREKAEKAKLLQIVSRSRRMSTIMRQRKFSGAKRDSSPRSKNNQKSFPRKGTIDLTFSKAVRNRSCSMNLHLAKIRSRNSKNSNNNDENVGKPAPESLSNKFSLHLHTMKVPTPATNEKVLRKKKILEESPEKVQQREAFKELAKETIKKLQNSGAEPTDQPQQKAIGPAFKDMLSVIMARDKGDMLSMVKKTIDKNSSHMPAYKLVEYLKFCAEEKVVPLPIMTNISNGTLTLENHKLSDGVGKAIGKFLPMLNELKKVVLINNGLTDDGFVHIMSGIRESETIKRLECSGNIIGEKSLIELSNILGKCALNEQFLELSLNRVKMSTNHLNSVLEIMGNNCPLRKLGLSRLFFDEISVDWLIKILSRAKNLYSLNLSGCEMLAIHLNKVLQIIAKNRRLEYIDLSWLPIGTQGEMTVSKLKEEILAAILKFITRNRQLVHLDLSYSRLTDTQCNEIVGAVTKSSSIMAVHMTGNGITDGCKAKTLENLGGVKIELEKFRSEFEDVGHLSPKAEEKKGKSKMVGDQKYILWKIRSTPELHLANTWVESNHCFICQKWRYTVFVFSAELAAKRFIELHEIPRSSYFRSGLEKIGENSCVPHFLCDTYQYQPMKLMEMHKFCSAITPEMKAKISIRNLYSHISTNSKLRPYFVFPQDAIQTLPLVSEVFVTAVMLPPNKLDYYMVRDDKKRQIYLGSSTIPSREDEIRALPAPPRRKRVRVFNKASSVFRSWYEDTPKLLAAVFKRDFNHSKLSRMIKSKIEREAVYELLEKHFSLLKEEFTSIIVKSTYPNISWNDFTLYCQQKGITSKDITLSVLDRLFITVNANIDSKADEYANPNRELCRSEFVEILVRVAAAKYKDTGYVGFLQEAVEMFLKEILSVGQLPMIHEFRKNYIWTLPVDDILRSNREGIRKVYQRYSGIKRYMSMTDAIQLIEKDCGYNIHRLEIVKAYGYSKMTVKDEFEHANEYNRMTEDEFLEFIARMALVLHKEEGGEDKPIEEKIDLLLVKLLGLVKALKYPPYVPEDSSDDDDDIDN